MSRSNAKKTIKFETKKNVNFLTKETNSKQRVSFSSCNFKLENDILSCVADVKLANFSIKDCTINMSQFSKMKDSYKICKLSTFFDIENNKVLDVEAKNSENNSKRSDFTNYSMTQFYHAVNAITYKDSNKYKNIILTITKDDQLIFDSSTQKVNLELLKKLETA